MHAGRLTAQRLSLLALAVVALHVMLIASLADRLAVNVAPQAMHLSPRLAVRTVEHKPFGAQAAAAVVQALATSDSTALRDRRQTESGDLVDRGVPSAAPTAPRRAERPRQVNTAPLAQPPVPAETGRIAALASPANALSARAEAQSPTAQATSIAPIDASPAPAVESPSTQSAPPVYPTQIPPAFAFTYTLTRGAVASEVELRWQLEGGRYVASLEGRDGGNALIAWRSMGGFDAAGIAPRRFVDHRQGRGALAVNFQRDAGKVTFSGPQVEHAIVPGVQDRLSWLLELAAMAAADPARISADGAALPVAGVRGDVDLWRFEHMAPEALDLGDGALPALHLLRRPERAYDTRAEVWLDPSRHYLPLRVRLSNGGETLQLAWRGIAPPR